MITAPPTICDILRRMTRRLILAIILVAALPSASKAASEAEIAQIALNAISLCVHAALYQHDGVHPVTLYNSALTIEHPPGAVPSEHDCLWAQLHREGTLDRSGPTGRETRVNQALMLQVISAYVTMPPPIPPQYLQFRVQPLDSYPPAERAAVGMLQTTGLSLTWQARWADRVNPDAAPPTLGSSRR